MATDLGAEVPTDVPPLEIDDSGIDLNGENLPQTGILGVGAIQKRVVVTADDAIAIHPMVYITLTFDHRVLDGAGADWFVAEIKHILENWQG